MSQNIGGIPVIFAENPQQCDYCGKVAELRPYGNGGACICFQCGMNNPEETERNFNRVLLKGEKPQGADNA